MTKTQGKLSLCVFLISIMVCGFVICGNLQVVVAQEYTDVSGVISSDTTWTTANSPYRTVGNILVNNGVTLTIEPGVLLLLANNSYIMVDGTLAARGNSDNRIHISNINGEIIFTPHSSAWNEQTGSGCIIENTHFGRRWDYALEIDLTSASPKISDCTGIAQISIDGGSPVLSNNTMSKVDINSYLSLGKLIINSGSPVISNGFLGNELEVNGGSPEIVNNTFNDNGRLVVNSGEPIISGNYMHGCRPAILSKGGTPYISNNIIYGGSIGIISEEESVPYISGNTIDNCETGIDATAGTIELNNICDSDYGIEIGNCTVRNNSITNNGVGIIIKGDSRPTINYNNIESLTSSTMNLLPGEYIYTIDATYNWWGTANTSTISESIKDFKTDSKLSTVTFIPFLTELNSETEPPYTPDVTEFPSWVILPLLLSLVLVVVFFRKKIKEN